MSDEMTFEEEVQFKIDRQTVAEGKERLERRERIIAAGHDPDAYPRTQDKCHHPYFSHKGRCFACGIRIKKAP